MPVPLASDPVFDMLQEQGDEISQDGFHRCFHKYFAGFVIARKTRMPHPRHIPPLSNPMCEMLI